MRKQRIISTVVAFACVLLIFAVNTTFASTYLISVYTTTIPAVAYAEETEWRYRVRDGVLEKRLWSITHERWLTDWMPVHP